MNKLLHNKLFVALLIMLGACMNLSAASYITRDGIRYVYNTAKTSVTVTVLSNNQVYVGDVVVPESIVNSSNETIPVVGVASSAFSDCTALTSVTLPASAKTIGDYAFDGCTGLKKIEMPGVTSIGHWSFRNCFELEDLKFGDNLKSIGNYCFDKNLKMTVVDLPATTTNIGGWAFEGNPQITTVVCRAANPPEVKKGYIDGLEIWTLFEDNDYGDIKLYVPAEAINTYKATRGWLQFGNNIFPLEEYEGDKDNAPVANAYRMGDTSQQFGFISFPVNTLDVTTVKSVASSSPQVGAGEYVDGKIYSYTYSVDYLFGEGLEVDQFVVWDTENNYSQIKNIDVSGVRIFDMTFDYTTNTMYAIGETKKGSNGMIGSTALFVIDTETGKATLVGDSGNLQATDGYGRPVTEYLMTIAASPAGELYGMGDFRQLYKVDKRTGKATPVGERKKVAVYNDIQTMAFTPDGKLYYAQAHPDYEYFMQLNPEDGTQINPVTGEVVVVNADFTNNAARFPNDAQVTSLYFTGRNVNPKSPLACTSMTAALRAGTASTVDLAWTLPAKDYAGNPVTLTEIKVYRFGTTEPIATLAGDVTSYSDTQAPDGDVTYCIVPVSGLNVGFPVWATTLAGADVLKAVENLTATLDGSKATVTWTAPTATVNGGYADFAAITYNVNLVSGSTVTEIAKGQSATSITYDITAAGTYSFEVIPVSCGIDGTPAVSNEVTITKSASIPYKTSFEDDEDGTLWTIQNVSTGAYGWSIITGYAYQQLKGKFAQFKTAGSGSFPTADLMSSPAISFPAGNFTLTYFANGASYDTHSYEVYIGTAPGDCGTLIQKVENEKVYGLSDTNNYQVMSVDFSIEEAGTYYLVFKGIGCATYATLKIDELSITKAAPTVPYFTSFEDDEENPWTIQNVSTGSYGWSIIKGYAYQQFNGKFAQFKTGGSATIPTSDLFISPTLKVPAGNYTLKYYAAGGSIDNHTYQVYLSQDDVEDVIMIQNVENMLINGTETNNYKEISVDFSVETSGNYNIVFKGIGSSTFATLKIDDLSLTANSGVEEVSANRESAVMYDSAARKIFTTIAENIAVYDVQGIEVASAEGTELSVENLSAGIYIVRAGTSTLKIAVK